MSDTNREARTRERRRRLAQEKRERQRRERLLREVESVALDFQHEPEQIGYYLAEHVRLRPGDRDRIEELLHSLAGTPLVARAFAAAGFIPAPDALAATATTSDWLAGDVRDIYDSERTAGLLEAIRADWGQDRHDLAGDRPKEAGERADVPPPQLGSWADVHGRERRTLADEVVKDWREAAARVTARRTDDPSGRDASPLAPRVGDIDPERAGQTRRLLDVLLGQLGLPAQGVSVHADEAAARELAATGARGLAKHEEVFLDPASYDPQTPSGRELLAHEVIHLAQRRVSPLDSDGTAPPIASAEAEANRQARSFAVGEEVTAPSVRLTASVAAATPTGQDRASVLAPQDWWEHWFGEVLRTIDGLDQQLLMLAAATQRSYERRMYPKYKQDAKRWGGLRPVDKARFQGGRRVAYAQTVLPVLAQECRKSPQALSAALRVPRFVELVADSEELKLFIVRVTGHPFDAAAAAAAPQAQALAGELWTADVSLGAEQARYRLLMLPVTGLDDFNLFVAPLAATGGAAASDVLSFPGDADPNAVQVDSTGPSELQLGFQALPGTPPLPFPHATITHRVEEDGPPASLERVHVIEGWAGTKPGEKTKKVGTLHFRFEGTKPVPKRVRRGGRALPIADELGRQLAHADPAIERDDIEHSLQRLRKQASKPGEGVLSRKLWRAWHRLGGVAEAIRNGLASGGVPEPTQLRAVVAAAEFSNALDEFNKTRRSGLKKAARVEYQPAPGETIDDDEDGSNSEPLPEPEELPEPNVTGLVDFISDKRYREFLALCQRQARYFDDYLSLAYGRRQSPKDRQRAAAISNLHERREMLGGLDRRARRVAAVFIPDDPDEHLNGVKQLPLQLFFWREGDDWELRDKTSPKHPWENDVSVKAGQEVPDKELFDDLKRSRNYPPGYIYYQVPGGVGERIRTNQPKWYDDLADVATGVLVAGAILASAGTGAIAVVGAAAVVAGSVGTAVAEAAELADTLDHGTATASSVTLNIAGIVSSLAGGAAAAGKVSGKLIRTKAVGLRTSGVLSKVARFRSQHYVMLDGVEMAGNATAMAVLMGTAWSDIQEAQKIRDPEERSRAVRRSIMHAALGGFISVIALRGDYQSLRGDLDIFDTRFGPKLRPRGQVLSKIMKRGPAGASHPMVRTVSSVVQTVLDNRNLRLPGAARHRLRQAMGKVHLVKKRQYEGHLTGGMEAQARLEGQPLAKGEAERRIRARPGFTDVDTGHVYVNKAQGLNRDEAAHELFHSASKPGGVVGNKLLDEGITDWLTKKAGFGVDLAYRGQRDLVTALESKLGADVLMEAYFETGTGALERAAVARWGRDKWEEILETAKGNVEEDAFILANRIKRDFRAAAP